MDYNYDVTRYVRYNRSVPGICGMMWYGVVRCGTVWYGVFLVFVVWCGAVWYGVFLVFVVWCGMVWCGVVWCGAVWYGVVWCGTVSSALRCTNNIYFSIITI